MQLLNEHLLWSYRLAKFEVGAERRGVGRLSFAKFEEALGTRLIRLESSTTTANVLFKGLDPGAVWVRPKGVEGKKPVAPDGSSFVTVPEKEHDHQIEALSVRVLLEPTPEFATSEVIWLRAFGPALETVLSKRCLGNRLDVHGTPPTVPAGGRRVYRYWAPAYRRFKAGALTMAKWCLHHGNKRCVLATLDLTSYYDNIDPAFLLDDAFVEQVTKGASAAGVPFDPPSYREATASLLASFSTFRAKVAKVVGVERTHGIPIGALTSRMIANLALAKLDGTIEGMTGVRYYARYVDDLLIVYQPGDEQFTTAKDFVAKFVPLDTGVSTDERLIARADLLGRVGSSFIVQAKKLRVFDIHGEQGLEYLKAVEAEMARVSSERRRFLDPWAAELDQTVMASPNAEPITALREADALSLRRLAVSTVSDKVATAAAMLDRPDAAAFSRRFLGRAARLATDWSRWVELIDVSLRLLGSALTSGDAETANEVIGALMVRAASLDANAAPPFKIKWGDDELKDNSARRKLREWVEEQIVEVIAGATPYDDSGLVPPGLAVVKQGITVRGKNLKGLALFNRAKRLAAADLRLVDRETDEQIGSPRVARPPSALTPMAASLAQDAEYAKRAGGLQGFLDVSTTLSDPSFAPMTPVEVLLLFRPPTYLDILFRWIRAQRPLGELVDVVNAVRGTRYETIPMTYQDDGQGGTVVVEPPTESSFDPAGEVLNTRLVLANLRTEDGWWMASLTKPALTDERQKRLARVINLALDAAKQGKHRPTLLVLPELSLPRRWWRQVCAHLARSEPMVSLVAGLEYDVVGKKVYNEAMAYFPRPFFSAAMWAWTKRRPANHEAPELQRLGYSFSKRAEDQRFVRVRSEHGHFLPLICSELLEVDTRARLLNRVDFVLIPAWNKDTTSFEYLVHASALELHSFVAVANNGNYSDCRIRGPYGEPAWLREVCRLIDRESDEVVAAMIPVHHLRDYRVDPVTYSKRIDAWIAAVKSAKSKIKKAKKEKKKPKFTDEELAVVTPDGTDVMPCPWPAWKPAPPGDSWPGSDPA